MYSSGNLAYLSLKLNILIADVFYKMFLMDFVKLNYIIITIILDIFSLYMQHILLNSNLTQFHIFNLFLIQTFKTNKEYSLRN